MFLLGKDYWEVRKTRNKGRGIFAKKPIFEKTIIGDYVGALVELANFDFDVEKANQYLMYYSETQGIYPDLSRKGIHLLNHSCKPNCFIYVLKRHTLVFALRDIIKGEELTISYLLPPKSMCINCSHKCYCGNENCTQTMHLKENEYERWQAFLEKEGTEDNILIEGSELKPFIKYPDSVPESYVKTIKNLGIIS